MSQVFVGGLSDATEESDLYEAFNQYGEITRVDLRSGFAFVEFRRDGDADRAIDNLDGTRVRCAYVRVEKSMRRNKRCFKCNKPGHIAEECRTVIRKDNRRNDGRRHAERERSRERKDKKRDKKKRKSRSRGRRRSRSRSKSRSSNSSEDSGAITGGSENGDPRHFDIAWREEDTGRERHREKPEARAHSRERHREKQESRSGDRDRNRDRERNEERARDEDRDWGRTARRSRDTRERDAPFRDNHGDHVIRDRGNYDGQGRGRHPEERHAGRRNGDRRSRERDRHRYQPY